MSDIHDDLRDRDRERFARAVFLTIEHGHGFLGTKPWPSFRSWVPRARMHLPECMQPPRRKTPLAVRHGPVIHGKIQPIRKYWDLIANCYKTNEV